MSTTLTAFIHLTIDNGS